MMLTVWLWSFSWSSVCFYLRASTLCVTGICVDFRDRFDTVKVRLQTSKEGHFKGPLDCVLQTVRKEGVAGLYKGATPPLVGWMVMDSV
jgi:hypothetical protein